MVAFGVSRGGLVFVIKWNHMVAFGVLRGGLVVGGCHLVGLGGLGWMGGWLF